MSAKYYKVKEYQCYLEFFPDSNIVKRSFSEGEVFSATDEQLNVNQLDRIEECDPPEGVVENQNAPQENPKEKKEGNGQEQGSQGKEKAGYSIDEARQKLAGQKTKPSSKSEQPDPQAANPDIF